MAWKKDGPYNIRYSNLSDDYSWKGCEIDTKWSVRPSIGLWVVSFHKLKYNITHVTTVFIGCILQVTDEYSSECTILTHQSVKFVSIQTIIYMWSEFTILTD